MYVLQAKFSDDDKSYFHRDCPAEFWSDDKRTAKKFDNIKQATKWMDELCDLTSEIQMSDKDDVTFYFNGRCFVLRLVKY